MQLWGIMFAELGKSNLQKTVIIFDETTSSLDSNTEKQVLDNIKSFFSDKIVIFITHHPSVAKNADKIILFNDGTILDIGTHEELLVRCGYYKEMISRGESL